VPALAAAAVVLIAVMATFRAPAPARREGDQMAAQAPRHAAEAGPRQAKTVPPAPRAVARVEHDATVPVTASMPRDVPWELAAAPELFMDLPLLRNMEKLQHYDAILNATGDPRGEPQTNG